MPSSLYVPLLLAGMLAFGSSNSLFSKYQDMQCVENCDDPNPSKRVLYEQPVYQTLQMFIGEMFCFLPVLVTLIRERYFQSHSVQLPDDSVASEDHASGKPIVHLAGVKILLLWIPAACDLIGTTLMNVGLLYTPVSIYQMTRGSLVLFVGTFSVIFLRRRLWLYQWVSLLVVMGGIALVGWSGSLIKNAVKQSSLVDAVPLLRRAVDMLADDESEPKSALVGIFFILFAQMFTATQFVVEEKILGTHAISPLLAVGWEGFFGAFSVLLLIPILSIPSISVQSSFFDLKRGWHQTFDHPVVLWVGVATAISIAFFNFFGLSVTRHVSATARSLTDTCRTLTIWIVSLGLGWEKLLFPISLIQILGFVLVVYGTFLFNSLVSIPPCLPRPPQDLNEEGEADLEEAQGLLRSELDETATLPADLGQSGYDVVPAGQHALVQDRSRAD